jgi:hypothetical protein
MGTALSAACFPGRLASSGRSGAELGQQTWRIAVPHFKNPQRKVAAAWLCITLLGVFLALLPYASNMDMMRGGYALVMVSILLIITGLIATLVYRKRTRTLDAMLKGEDLLVHWTYTTQEWARFAEAEAKSDRSAKIGLFLVISAFALLFGLMFWLFGEDEEAGFLVFLAMAGLIAVIGLTAFLSIKIPYWRNRRRVGEVWISGSGAFVNGALHTWNSLGCRFEGVSYHRTSNPAVCSLLEFTYSYPARHGSELATVRLPVPVGRDAEARRVCEVLEARTEG